MRHERTEQHRRHLLVVRIEPSGEMFEASIAEPDTDQPHWLMSGPPLPYEEVVDEVLQALERHLRSAGE